MGKGISFYKRASFGQTIFYRRMAVNGECGLEGRQLSEGEDAKADEFAEIVAGDFFPLSGITIRDNLVDEPRLPKSKFYSWRNRLPLKDILIFIGDAQPSSGREYAFANQVMDIAIKFDGFVKSPSAALRFIFSHCGVLVSTPHS